jgi:hypothetical protein
LQQNVDDDVLVAATDCGETDIARGRRRTADAGFAVDDSHDLLLVVARKRIYGSG